MGMFGIIMMVIENELSSAGVYNKVSEHILHFLMEKKELEYDKNKP